MVLYHAGALGFKKKKKRVIRSNNSISFCVGFLETSKTCVDDQITKQKFSAIKMHGISK